MKDRFALIDFDAAHDVRVMADHDIGTCIDCRLRHCSLIGGESSARVHDAFVQRDNHHIRMLSSLLDVRCHVAERFRVGAFQGGCRRDRPISRRPHIYI